MDHDHVEAQNLVERYVLGRLSTEEQVRFEQHFADCDDCQEQLEAAQELESALRLTVAQDAATVVRAGFAVALWRWLRGPGGALVATALVVLALSPVLWLYGERHRLQGEVEALRRPLANVPTLELTLARDAGPAAVVRELAITPEQTWVALAIEAAPGPERYGAVLEDAAGQPVWRGEGLEPTSLGYLLLGFPAEMLPAGEYRLRLDAFDATGRGEPVGDHRFRIVR